MHALLTNRNGTTSKSNWASLRGAETVPFQGQCNDFPRWVSVTHHGQHRGACTSCNLHTSQQSLLSVACTPGRRWNTAFGSRRGKALVPCLTGDVASRRGGGGAVPVLGGFTEILSWFLLPYCSSRLPRFGSKICWLLWASSSPAGRPEGWLLCMCRHHIVRIWVTLDLPCSHRPSAHVDGDQPFRLTGAGESEVSLEDWQPSLLIHCLKELGNVLLKLDLLWKKWYFIEGQRVWGKRSCRI